jgi:MraZ protein
MSKKVVQSVAEATMGGSNALMGEFVHALDPKKRLTIPSEWRRAMGNPDFVYVMRDRNGKCLNLLPKAEMEMLLAKLRQKALFDPALTKAAMLIGANSEQLMIDVQGRIRISDKLLQFANLTTTVVMAGSVRMAKLWNSEAYAEESQADLSDYNAALDMLES